MDWLIKSWTQALSYVRRQKVLHERRIFYERIMERMMAEPDAAAIKFGQAELMRNARASELIIDESSGILYITIETSHGSHIGHFSYSLFLTGDLLRIGLLLYGGLENAPLIDWHNEMQIIWPGCLPDQTDRQGLTMYEWTFLLPDLYDRYPTQERYINGLRHMHSRVLRIVRDYWIVQDQEAGALGSMSTSPAQTSS